MNESRRGVSISRNYQEGVKFIFAEAANLVLVLPEESCSLTSGAIPEPDPNDFGRESKHKAALMKLRVFGNYRKTLLLSELPNEFVHCALQAEIPDVRRIWENRSQHPDQVVGKVLVEKKLHEGTVSSLRSRSAAKARQARMSSPVRSGKSSRISS